MYLEETQFFIINQAVFPDEVVFLVVYTFDKNDDVEAYEIRKVAVPSANITTNITANTTKPESNGLWSWKSKHLLRNVETGFCLSVADRNAPRFVKYKMLEYFCC